MKRLAAAVFALSLAASGQQSDPGAASYGQSKQRKSKQSAEAKVGGSPTHPAEKAPAAEGRPLAGYESGMGSAMAGGRTDTGPVGGVSARRRAAERDQANAEQNAPAKGAEGATQDARLNRKPGKPAVRMRATAKDKAQAQRRGRIRDRERPRSETGQPVPR